MTKRLPIVYLYAAAYALLLAIWLMLVLLGQQNPNADVMISWIRDALIGLSAHVWTVINPVKLAGGDDAAEDPNGGGDGAPAQ